jgi:quinol monooxygenase YgiN
LRSEAFGLVLIDCYSAEWKEKLDGPVACHSGKNGTCGFRAKELDMPDRITLVVRFRMNEAAKRDFTVKLQEVFTHIVKEEAFVEASLVQDMRDPESILNYEVWNESPESFMKNQMTKAYRAEFEKMIVDLKIDRTPAWYSTIADWKKA